MALNQRERGRVRPSGAFNTQNMHGTNLLFIGAIFRRKQFHMGEMHSFPRLFEENVGPARVN
jgi:hypothetical protein